MQMSSNEGFITDFLAVFLLNSVNFGEDCPVIDRLHDYCLTYASGSVGKIIYYFIEI